MKIIKIIEFHWIIKNKLRKSLNLLKNNEHHENYKIACASHLNHEHRRILLENNENQNNIIIRCQNHTNHENLRIQ